MTYTTNDDPFYGSMAVAMAQSNPVTWLEAYSYALDDLPFKRIDELEHRRQVVLFLQGCVIEQRRSTYHDGESSHV